MPVLGVSSGNHCSFQGNFAVRARIIEANGKNLRAADSMFCFLMALKSRQLSRDWDRVTMLCEASIRSAMQQTDPNIRVLLVSHEAPSFSRPFDKRLEIIRADFPPPEEEHVAMMRDKWRKLHIGMIRAGKLSPNFLMIMDADDLVSNRLAEYAASFPDSNGWTIRRGYQYSFGSRWIVHQNQFDCGTNTIINSRLIQYPTDLSEQGFNKCIPLRWGHTRIAAKLAEAGTPLDTLPFRGAMYISCHGENHSHGFFEPLSARSFLGHIKHFVRKPRWIGPFTNRIRREFAMMA